MMQQEQREILRFDHVSKAFFGVYAVKDVSFSTYAGDVLAIQLTPQGMACLLSIRN